MKKLFIVICALVVCGGAFADDNYNQKNVWSYRALADTIYDLQSKYGEASATVLLELSDFVENNNAEFSVGQLVNECVDLTKGLNGFFVDDNYNNSEIDGWSQELTGQKNEFCDVFVSEFISNHNSYVGGENSVDSNEANVSSNTYGCSVGKGIIASLQKCNDVYQNDVRQKSRCIKCVNNAGTYESGRCYIEVIGWNCTDKGWPSVKNPNYAPCSNQSHRYSGCRIIRRYVDAEKPFTCNPDSVINGQNVVLSGCGQHGWSAGDKHPPMHVSGNRNQDCKLPLVDNTDWRKSYRYGEAIGLNYNGKKSNTTNWCMPGAGSSPWNSENHTGGAKHLREPIMSGGESNNGWFSLD